MPELITHEQLIQVTGCKTISSLEKCLRAQKIPFLYGNKGKIFTTIEALNAAMGLKSGEPTHDPIEFI